eukprot:6190817-Pleurochrysis_carterae.AAC.3
MLLTAVGALRGGRGGRDSGGGGAATRASALGASVQCRLLRGPLRTPEIPRAVFVLPYLYYSIP